MKKQIISTAAALMLMVAFPANAQDVYVAGYEKNNQIQSKTRATLWKNGSPQYLSDWNGQAVANSVFLSGDDVFIAGTTSNDQGNGIAMLWKNGEPQTLRLSENWINSKAKSVFVSGNDVYVVGSSYLYKTERGMEAREATWLWKNGVPQPLSLNSEYRSIELESLRANDR